MLSQYFDGIRDVDRRQNDCRQYICWRLYFPHQRCYMQHLTIFVKILPVHTCPRASWHQTSRTVSFPKFNYLFQFITFLSIFIMFAITSKTYNHYTNYRGIKIIMSSKPKIKLNILSEFQSCAVSWYIVIYSTNVSKAWTRTFAIQSNHYPVHCDKPHH